MKEGCMHGASFGAALGRARALPRGADALRVRSHIERIAAAGALAADDAVRPSERLSAANTVRVG
jgi:hypothetical protein